MRTGGGGVKRMLLVLRTSQNPQKKEKMSGSSAYFRSQRLILPSVIATDVSFVCLPHSRLWVGMRKVPKQLIPKKHFQGAISLNAHISGGTESITGFFQMMKLRPKDVNDTSTEESEFEPGVMLILGQYGSAA